MNCDDDSMWSDMFLDPKLGACHTYNPCASFEGVVGKRCVFPLTWLFLYPDP